MPEELALSLAGRLARWNGFDLSGELWTEVRATLSAYAIPADPLSKFECLAALCEMPIERFVARHSMLPLRGAFDAKAECKTLAAPRAVSDASGFRSLRAGAYLCRSCVAEDLDFHGYAWWRRDHQAPGQMWCPKHGTTLLHHPSPECLWHSPVDALDAACEVKVQPLSGLKGSDIISRFLAIQDGLLNAGRRLNRCGVSKLLAQREFELSNGGPWRCQSEKLLAVIDIAWLETIYPGVVRGTPRFRVCVAAALRGYAAPVALEAYVLLAALMWDSADDALIRMLSSKGSYTASKSTSIQF